MQRNQIRRSLGNIFFREGLNHIQSMGATRFVQTAWSDGHFRGRFSEIGWRFFFRFSNDGVEFASSIPHCNNSLVNVSAHGHETNIEPKRVPRGRCTQYLYRERVLFSVVVSCQFSVLASRSPTRTQLLKRLELPCLVEDASNGTKPGLA